MSNQNISKLYKRARELGFPTAKPKNTDREFFTGFISFEEDRRKKLQKRSTARLMSHIQSEYNVPKTRAQGMGRNGILSYINEQKRIEYEDQKRERVAQIKAVKKRALAARPQIVKKQRKKNGFIEMRLPVNEEL